MTVPPEIYAPRPLRHLMAWQVGPIRAKAYHIGRRPPREDRIATARRAAERMGPESEAEGDGHGLGFVVLHEGHDGTWLLMDWWAHGGILCQRLSLDDGGGFRAVDDRPLLACVWELPVIAYERGAWIRHMMRAPASPGRYLSDLLPAGIV